jgi:Nif-specific regulatory protein
MSSEGVIDREAIALTGIEDELPLGVPGTAKPEFNTEGMNEREQVIAALEQAGWVQAKAARLLNMTPRQIAYRVRILNIKMRHI